MHARYLILVCLIAGAGAGCARLDHNLQVVEEGTLYRSGQMPANRIGMYLDRHDIGTVVNLRGADPDDAWYRDEVAVCDTLGVEHHSLKWSMSRIPDPESLAALVRLLQESDRPVLVHCQGGAHRAATASAVYVLLNGGTPDEARDQFKLFFMGAPIGELIDLYEGSEMPFDRWVVKEYPDLYAARAE